MRPAPRAGASRAPVKRRGITGWIAATTRRPRGPTPPGPADGTATPIAPAPDAEKVAIVGDALQSCFPEAAEPLDDHLTTLMLRLAVEPVILPAKRER